MSIPDILNVQYDTHDDSKSSSVLLGYWKYDVIINKWTNSDELIKALCLDQNKDSFWIDTIHPDDLPQVKTLFRHAIDTHIPFQSTHRVIVNQHVVWVQVKSRVDLENGKLIAYYGTVEDITKTIVTGTEIEHQVSSLKKTINNLELQIEHLKTINKQTHDHRSGFLSQMSHEIRTPMNAMMGFTQLLKDTEMNHEQHEYVSRILDSSTHLLSIINDILDLSKMEAGKMSIEKRSFHLNKLIADVRDMLYPSAEKKHLYFDIETMNCPEMLIGDATRIKQVLINLLNNAIKFTDMGGVSLVVIAEKQENQNILVSFKVKDSGIGMTSEQQKRLFMDYEQADLSTSRLYGGTGLGLSISKKLTLLMDGILTCQSTLNEGTTFTMTIPLQIDDSDDALSDHEHKSLKPNARILVAEDHLLSQRLTERLLQNLGASVRIVDNGEKAVQAMKEVPYDLVFLDMNMPIMDGLQAAVLIRKFNTKTPLIALTANQYLEDKAQCLLSGMNDLLIKPIDMKMLEQMLIKWIPEE